MRGRSWWLVACLLVGAACTSSRAGLPTGEPGVAGSVGSRGGAGGGGGAGGRDGGTARDGAIDAQRDASGDGDGSIVRTGGVDGHAPDAVIDAISNGMVDVRPPMDNNIEAPPPDVRVPVDMRPILPDVGPDVVDARPAYWKPPVAATWDWQLVVPIKPDVNVQIYVIDLFENSAGVIADLHARGRKVLCQVDLGTWERDAPDADRFPIESLGATFDGDSDQRWIDIRNLRGLSGMLRGRLDLAASKGCDGVVPDNLDAWDTRAHEGTGFSLTNIDQLVYNRTIVAEAHNRGMSVGLKGNVRQVDDLVGDFDFHVSENCYMRSDCSLVLPFVHAGKAVLDAESSLATSAFCPMAKRDRVSAIKKRTPPDTYSEACPP